MGLNAVQSYPAERVLVAALLGRPASFHELGGRVTEEMFTEPGLRLVFRAFAELASRGERIDMATVEAEMFRLDHRLYGELNGVSFLSAMLQAVRNDSHIHEYVRLVQREWMLRGCVASLNKRGLEAQQPDVDVMKLLAGVTDDMDGLREHASGGVDVRMAAEVAREVLARSFRNQEAREKGEHIQVRTGFDELDDLTGGLYRGELAVLSGRPSMGKTAVALHMALQAVRAGRNTLYFSIEMSEEEVTERILSMLSGVEAGKIRFKGTNREGRALLEKAAAELAGLPLRIVYCGSLAIDEIRAVLMTRKARRELDIFFIDYLNLIHIPYTRGSRNETTDLALGDVVRKVKLMAVELDVPAVLLAQMNRDSDRRLAPYLPILSDLRNSGAIEQVADQGHLVAQYSLAKLYLSDDLEVRDTRKGMNWLYTAAVNGSHYAMYRLAKELFKGDLIKRNSDAAVEWFTRSAERGNPYAQYMLGKLYLAGKEVPRDEEKAAYWLTQSAEQGNQYAQYLLNHLEENRPPSAMLAVTRLLHHMSRIFRDNSVPKSRPGGIQIDRKRLKKLQEKRMALGHNPNDHEEQWPDMTM